MGIQNISRVMIMNIIYLFNKEKRYTIKYSIYIYVRHLRLWNRPWQYRECLSKELQVHGLRPNLQRIRMEARMPTLQIKKYQSS
jgi:hypothetical protein